jgi:hypothetical protein
MSNRRKLHFLVSDQDGHFTADTRIAQHLAILNAPGQPIDAVYFNVPKSHVENTGALGLPRSSFLYCSDNNIPISRFSSYGALYGFLTTPPADSYGKVVVVTSKSRTRGMGGLKEKLGSAGFEVQTTDF